jgi:tripartite-type tricarboxylate transporter receptor subunit TctC
MKKLVLAFAAALCLLVTAESAPAQNWPQQPIHIIVSFGPGAAPTSSAASLRTQCKTGSASR